VVLTCSALRQRYRDRLRAVVPDLRFVFLSLTPEQARVRVAARPAHLFPVSLVASQFKALEDPSAEPGVLRLDATPAGGTDLQARRGAWGSRSPGGARP
jgi:gluconokinase